MKRFIFVFLLVFYAFCCVVIMSRPENNLILINKKMEKTLVIKHVSQDDAGNFIIKLSENPDVPNKGRTFITFLMNKRVTIDGRNYIVASIDLVPSKGKEVDEITLHVVSINY